MNSLSVMQYYNAGKEKLRDWAKTLLICMQIKG